MALETIVMALALLVTGAAFCFGGYKWFMILLPVWGFITGFFVGAYAVSNVYGQSLLSIAVLGVAGVILGLIFAVIAYLLFPAAVILLGASLGYTAGWTIMTSLGFDPGLIPIAIGIVGAILIAVLAIRFHLPKYVIMVSTALLGSIGIIIAVLLLIGEISLGEFDLGLTQYLTGESATWPIVWVALAAVGMLVQFRRARAYEMDLSSQTVPD